MKQNRMWAVCAACVTAFAVQAPAWTFERFVTSNSGDGTIEGDTAFSSSTATVQEDGTTTVKMMTRGNDIWSSSDSGGFCFESVGGDAEVSATVQGFLQEGDNASIGQYAKAGVMMRQTSLAAAPHVFLYRETVRTSVTDNVTNYTSRICFSYRSTRGGTTTGINSLMDRWAEGLLMNLIDIAPGIAEDHKNYDLMSQYMLSATMGLNGFIAMGVPQDWATHMIGHELTALHGVTHGESLAIVLPATMTVLSEQKKLKILQYGERVWGITEGSESERITKAIEKTEQFFRLLGLKTRLHELNIGEETIAEIERRFNERGVKLGECKNVTGTVARAILECAL